MKVFRSCGLKAAMIAAAMLLLGSTVAYAQQTPGQIVKFGPGSPPPLENSIITEDLSGNIGIGTTTPTARLDVAGGNVNLDNSTATAGNILKGGVPFIHNFGPNNTFVGLNAGNLTMTGFRNTASGEGALFSNTTGFRNTASGQGALFSNDTGFRNTASGEGALFSNTTGFRNTASGVNALQNNTTGFRNTASGIDALFSNTDGFSNTASGDGALSSNTTGSNNTAVGAEANVSVGNLTNATAIGAGAIVDASDKIRLGNSAVTVVEGAPYNTVSDKTKKENFKPVDGEEVLKKIRHIPVNSWNFIGHDPKQFRHYGPVAQDFFAAFGHDGIGTIGTPTTISSTDMAGILMIAVRALERRTRELDALKADNSDLKAKNADLTARLETLERLMKTTQTAWSEATE